MIISYHHASFSIWYFTIPVLIFSFLIAYGSYFINSDYFVKAYCKSLTTKKEIALSFDDGPVESTEKVLDILKTNAVPGAFFCIGNRMLRYPEILKRIETEGHIIGNHSFTHHFLFDVMSKNQMLKEMRDTNAAAEKIIKRKLKLFRPPYGVTTPVLAKAIKEENFDTIGWSLRSYDTMMDDKQQLIDKIEKKIKPGDIVLLHDSQSITVAALENIIHSLKQKGFTFVRLDHLLNINAYA